MDHAYAVENQSVERYLLGEMAPAQAEEFELHYFECQECALAVESGRDFIDDARAVLSNDLAAERPAIASPGKKPSLLEAVAAWWARPSFLVPAAAAVALAAVVLYQGTVTIPSMRTDLDSARAIPAFQLNGASRGEGSRIVLARGTPWLALSADIPPDAHFPLYHCVLTAGGNTIFQVSAPAPADGQPFTLLIPARNLTSGRYELSISGRPASNVDSGKIIGYSYDLQIQ